MPLLPSPQELLAIADRIAGHAGAARSRADTLARAAAATHWHGAAAGAFRDSADSVLLGLRWSASRLDDAAATLRAHAHRVAGVLADLRRGLDDLDAFGTALVHTVGDVLGSPHHLARDAQGLVTGAGAVAVDSGVLLGDAIQVFGW
jgi:uncharacterized protein YukE